MNYCVYCGKQIDKNDKFCPYCGKELPEIKSKELPSSQKNQNANNFQGKAVARKPFKPLKNEGRWKIIVLATVLTLFLVSSCLLMRFFIMGDAFNKTRDLGKSDFKEPTREALVETAGFGIIPANQVLIILDDASDRGRADDIAKSVSGKVVGEIEYLNLYQIETAGKTEADLISTIENLLAVEHVESAFPNAALGMDNLEGTSCSPLKDPIFGEGDNSKPYDLIGMKDAWGIIKGSGVKLNNVNVGVLDSAIYTGSDEFAGKVKVDGDTTKSPTTDKNGIIEDGGLSHGTMVTHVIGADPENSGMVGVASILENKLNIKVKNLFDGQDAAPPANSDVGDITQAIDPSDHRVYTMKALVYLKEQVESGATVINCSIGVKTLSEDIKYASDAYKRFFQKINQDYPDVVFVAAAGNNGNADKSKGKLTGTNQFPGGISVPNLITVGALENDGRRADFSCFAGEGAEVTVSAPGVDMVLGVDGDGKPIKASGTSFSAPQVTATIALLQSINPKLTAQKLKDIIVKTSAPGVTNGNQSIPIPAGMGQGMLKVDEAVLEVINDLRVNQGLPTLTKQQFLDASRVTLSAQGTDAKYTLVAGIPAAQNGGTDVKIEVMGQHVLAGSSTQQVASGGTAAWEIEIVDPSVFLRVTRLDTGTCSTMTLTKMSDFSGLYNVVFTEKTKWKASADWDTSQLTPIQVRVEQNGTDMRITFLDKRGIVLTGTYDEVGKKFAGQDLRRPDNPYETLYWQGKDTIITFDPNSNTAKGNLDMSAIKSEDGSEFLSVVIDLDMTKVSEN